MTDQVVDVAVPRPEIAPPSAPTPGGARGAGLARRARAIASVGALYAVSIAVAFAIAAVLVAFTHGSPHQVFSAMYSGSFKTWGAFGYTLDYATPLLIVAVGTIVSVRAGFFNIGQEGQLMIGAMCGAFVALKVHPAGPGVLVLALVASALGGAAWAGVAALLKFWRGIDIVISSLLLIFIAGQLLSYVLESPSLLQEHVVGGATQDESDQLSSKVQLPRVGEYPHLNFSTGLFIALVLAAVIAVVVTRTRWGFSLRMLGHNPVVARRAGVSAAIVGSAAIMISGACAGLAGGVVLTGENYRLTTTLSNNMGWNGLLVALVARNNPVVAVVVAIFFGALQAGSGFLETTGVPTDLVNIVVALLVLAAVFPPAVTELRRFRRARAQAAASLRAPTGAAA